MSVRRIKSVALSASAAILVAGFTVTTPQAQASEVVIRPAFRQSVFVVGDSLTVGSQQSLKFHLHSSARRIGIDARVGRFTNEGISKLRTASARRYSIWVVALGTNDGPSASAMKSYVRRVMRLAGKDRKVVWVNVVRPGGYDKVNTALARSTKRYPNLSVVDWARFIAHHRYYLAGDRVHLNSQGYSIRGQMIAQAVHRLVAVAARLI